MLDQTGSTLRRFQSIAVVGCQDARYSGVLMEFLKGDHLPNSGFHDGLRAVGLGHPVLNLRALADPATDRDKQGVPCRIVGDVSQHRPDLLGRGIYRDLGVKRLATKKEQDRKGKREREHDSDDPLHQHRQSPLGDELRSQAFEQRPPLKANATLIETSREAWFRQLTRCIRH